MFFEKGAGRITNGPVDFPFNRPLLDDSIVIENYTVLRECIAVERIVQNLVICLVYSSILVIPRCGLGEVDRK